MGGLILFLAFIIMLFAVYGVLNSFFLRASIWTKSYQELGKRYGTRVTFSGLRPKLVFSYGHTPCLLRSTGRGAKQATQLQINWIDRHLKMLITQSGQPTGFFNRPNSIDIDLPNASFTVYANNEQKVRDMINATTSWQIQQLMDLGGTGAEIDIHGGKMRISKPGLIKEATRLDDFVRFGLDLFDQFKLAVNKDLEFISEDEAAVVDDVNCPICSGEIVGKMVICVRCKTPHCADCWEYNGQCSTFACNETRYFDPAVSAETAPQKESA